MCNHLYILDLLDLVDLDLYSTVRYSTGTGTISPVPYLPNETDTEMRDPAFPLSCCMLQLLLRMQCMEAVHTVPVSAYQCQLGPVSYMYCVCVCVCVSGFICTKKVLSLIVFSNRH